MILAVAVDDRVVWYGDRVIVVPTGRVAGDSAEVKAMLNRATKKDVGYIMSEIERLWTCEEDARRALEKRKKDLLYCAPVDL